MNHNNKFLGFGLFTILIFMLPTCFLGNFPIVGKSNNLDLRLNDFDDIFGEIFIIRPSSSDILKIGENFTIKWEYKGSIDLVSIALYNGINFFHMIAIVTINDGEYSWFIANYTESNDYSIGIWDYNDFNNNDFSEFFTITSLSNNNLNHLIYLLIGLFLSIPLISVLYYLIKLRKPSLSV
ncbi:MAG: Ser-Thr-rich GPI-anchored membrane family protein [Promethearchaeota archaeon]